MKTSMQRAKLQELVEESRSRGWRNSTSPEKWAVEALQVTLADWVVTGAAKKRAIKTAREAAEKATRWLRL